MKNVYTFSDSGGNVRKSWIIRDDKVRFELLFCGRGFDQSFLTWEGIRYSPVNFLFKKVVTVSSYFQRVYKFISALIEEIVSGADAMKA